MTEVGTFVLKDEQDNYLSGDSIFYNRKTRKFIYSYSRFLTNGFYTYPSQEKAEDELENLMEMVEQLKFKKKFRVKKIDMIKIFREEIKLNIPKYPFIHEVIERQDQEAIA